MKQNDSETQLSLLQLELQLVLLLPELLEEEEQLLLSKEEEKELLDLELDEMKLLEDDCELTEW